MPPLTVILLAGGFGSRIRGLYPDLPKPMIPVAGKPFLEWALRYWDREGVHRAIVSLGHLAPVAQAYFATRLPDHLEIVPVAEPQALGTGGAVRFAAASSLSDPFFVANADSLVLAPTAAAQKQMEDDPQIDGVILGAAVPDTSRFGTLATTPSGRLTAFLEKQPQIDKQPGLINAGIYLFRQRLLSRFPPQTPLSMETEVIPALISSGAHLQVVPVQAPFLDIGTPESLSQAESFIKTHFSG